MLIKFHINTRWPAILFSFSLCVCVCVCVCVCIHTYCCLITKSHTYLYIHMGFPGVNRGKEPTCQGRRHKRSEYNPLVRKISWRRAWLPITVFVLGESHRQRSLVGYSQWGHTELDTTEDT